MKQFIFKGVFILAKFVLPAIFIDLSGYTRIEKKVCKECYKILAQTQEDKFWKKNF